MSDAALYHQALLEYREGKAAPELLSKAYVLAADSTNPKAQEIEYVKLRVKELSGTGAKKIAEKASVLIDNTIVQAKDAYAELQVRNKNYEAIVKATDIEDANAVKQRDPSIDRTAYIVLTIATSALFTFLAHSLPTMSIGLVSAALCAGVVIAWLRLRNTGDHGVWALTALVPFNFALGIYCLVARPNRALSRRKAVLENFRGDATNAEELAAFLESLPKAPERAKLTGVAVFSAIASVVLLFAFVYVLYSGPSAVNSVGSIASPTYQPEAANPQSSSSSYSPQLSQWQIDENQAHDAILEQLQKRFPNLNPDSPSFDANLARAIYVAEQENEQRGDRPPLALRNAIIGVVGDIWAPPAVKAGRTPPTQHSQGNRSKCEIKDVMTDDDIAACRPQNQK